jgi:hypothetical protein
MDRGEEGKGRFVFTPEFVLGRMVFQYVLVSILFWQVIYCAVFTINLLEVTLQTIFIILYSKYFRRIVRY